MNTFVLTMSVMPICTADEDFNEILYNIKCYEQYCKDHPEYENNRAVHAIRHIENVYDERMEENDPE